MTAASAKGRQPRGKHKKPAVTKNTSDTELATIILIVILAGIPFALGRYFELSYPDPFDSAANVYSAQHILDGAKIGVDEQPSAALGTLLVNILGVRLFGFNEFGPKLIQTIMQAGALVAMFIVMRKLFGKLPAAAGVIVVAVYLSCPLLSKFGNVKEQYAIACMVTGVSFFVLRQLGGGWWYGVLAGATAAWAPLFKPTGTSAIGAIGLFVLVQPIFRHRTWKQTGIDIVLLLAGAAAAIAPLYIWIIGWNVQLALPYAFVYKTISAGQTASGTSYVSGTKAVIPFSEQWPKVLRFYRELMLPISLALGSIAVRVYKLIAGVKRQSAEDKSGGERFVLLFAVWWLLDMAFVWISPRSYEQYYLPLNASAAMTGGYIVAIYRDKLSKAVFKTKWAVTGVAAFAVTVFMSWHIFFGLPRSPYSGTMYPQKRNGYLQRWNEISMRHTQGYKGPWEVAGEYIRSQTQPSDKIYVWGWVPGIYLSAQRFSSAPKAFESEMHTRTPEEFAKKIDELLATFKKQMPKFIVDTRKNHVPLERPPHELWPIVPKGFMGIPESGFLPDDDRIVAEFEKQYSNMLRQKFDEAEAGRFEAVGRLREFIRANFEIAQVFGQHVVFRLKTAPMDAGNQ